MHSIKNTVIAVGLLGLSFLFYQASSNKSDTEEMVPALEITDSLDSVTQLATDSMDAVKSKVGSLPSIEMPKIEMPNFKLPDAKLPDLAKSNQMAADFAADMGRTLKNNTAPLKESANDFSKQVASQFPQANANPPAVFGGAKTQAQASQNFGSNNFAGSNDFGAKPKSPTNPSIPGAVARDEGLIAALGRNQMIQNQFAAQTQPAQPPTQTVSTAPSTGTNDFGASSSFGSQPIPSSDGSYNKLATDESSKPGSGVVHADSNQLESHLDFQSAWPQVQKLSDERKYRDALRLLSRYYRSNDLTGPQRQQLIAWLDALAGKVIFSDEHHLKDMPYTVANESLVDIGERWRVPGQLIYNINKKKISNPAIVPPGTQLKMIEGPFSAEIDTQQKVMTLFLDDLYAGRFPVRMGVSGTPKPGSFRVLLKSADGHNWRDAQGNDYPPGTPQNGYGPNWIGLSGSLCLHAVDDSAVEGHNGCIGLSPKDAKDVFAILAKGSSVKILR